MIFGIKGVVMKQEFNVTELFYISISLERQIAAAEATFNRDLDRTAKEIISEQIMTYKKIHEKVSNYIKEGVKNEKNGTNCI